MIRLGMLTPSSNTVLEPVTAAMLSGLDDVSAHFGRFRVVRIALGAAELGQFDPAPILDAARLLADAQVDVIAWNGTSSGWLGFESDQRLCQMITAETGIQATTSVLALNEIMADQGITRFGLASPYTGDVQEAIIANYARAGLTCVGERHLNEADNFSFATVDAPAIETMIREIALAEPQCITTFCTNLNAAPLVDRLEQETNIPIYDTISVVVWKSLQLAGVDPARVRGWGRLFG
jgi:maleate isomerase